MPVRRRLRQPVGVISEIDRAGINSLRAEFLRRTSVQPEFDAADTLFIAVQWLHHAAAGDRPPDISRTFRALVTADASEHSECLSVRGISGRAAKRAADRLRTIPWLVERIPTRGLLSGRSRERRALWFSCSG